MEQSVNKKRHSSNQTFSFSSDDSIKQRFFAYYCHIIQKKTNQHPIHLSINFDRNYTDNFICIYFSFS